MKNISLAVVKINGKSKYNKEIFKLAAWCLFLKID